MCDAKRVGDQMMCGRCGIQWDHDDPDGDSCCPFTSRVDETPIARSLSITSMWRRAQPGLCDHVLYETEDVDKPREICDRNGEVVLALCRKCGKAEAELQ